MEREKKNGLETGMTECYCSCDKREKCTLSVCLLNDYALDQEMIPSQPFQDKLLNDDTKKVQKSWKFLF